MELDNTPISDTDKPLTLKFPNEPVDIFEPLTSPLDVILPVILRLSLKEMTSLDSPADSNLDANIVPLALIFPLAVI